MEVNEYLIKFKGDAVPVDVPLELQEDVELRVEGTVVKEERIDNNDGTINVVYVIKGTVSYLSDAEET